jgi:branched-chain amino acid transport system ATP-binding protein
MSALLLDVRNLEARYGDVAVLHGISLQVFSGQVVAILGANGAGKTTLMKALIGLIDSNKGSITFADRGIDQMRPDRRARLGIGYCPEGRRTFPGLCVLENLQVACFENAAERVRRVEEIFVMFPELGARADTPAWQLSGGQQQMLAIGRSLMGHPRLLLLDEPSLGLSPRLTDEVMDRIPVIRAAGTSVLLAEQNASKALQVSDTAFVLRTGQVIKSGPAAELARSDDVRAAFLGA